MGGEVGELVGRLVGGEVGALVGRLVGDEVGAGQLASSWKSVISDVYKYVAPPQAVSAVFVRNGQS